MKTLFALIASIAILAVSASAQNAGPLTVVSGGTNAIVASSTNATAAFAVSEYDSVGVQFAVKATGAATSTVRVDGYRSVDSTTYETAPSTQFFITLNGTTEVAVFTNLNVAGVGTYKFSLANTNPSVAVTNVSVIRRVKQVRVTAK